MAFELKHANFTAVEYRKMKKLDSTTKNGIT